MKNQNVKALFNASESMQTGKHRKNIIETFKASVMIQNAPQTEKVDRINSMKLLLRKTPNQLEIFAAVLHKRFLIQFPGAKIIVSCEIVKENGPIQYGEFSGEKFVELI
jgi:hypothetical protein